jgi:HEAT repeat protein
MKRSFVLGMLGVLVGAASLAFASKQDEAVKATQVLKSSKDTAAKIQAAIEIGNIGQIKKSYVADAIPYLIECCKDKEAKLRGAAAEALGKVDPPESSNAVDVLTDMAKNDKSTEVKIAAMKGLGSMGPSAKSALPTLRDIMNKEDKKSGLYRSAMDATRTINARK